MVGRGSLATLQPTAERHDQMEALLQAAAQSGKVEGIFEHRRNDGARVPVAATVSQRRNADDLSIGFLLVARDITEAQRTEAQRLQLIEEQAARSEAEAA